MKLSSRIKNTSLHALLLLPLFYVLPAGPAAAQAQPAATSTIDVCHDEVTGNWRYSGVVSLAGKGLSTDSALAISYKIQNKTSELGYADALLALQQPPIALQASPARVTSFSVDAAPLSLGTLRNASRILISNPLAPASPPLSLEAQADFAAAVCGCPKPTGCVRTQGYWKSKPGVTWPAPYSRTTMFFSSGLTWQQILETAPQGGNGYLILAHQYIAALLNRAGGASAPSSVQTTLNNATAFFSSGANLDSCGGSACETQKTWAGILDTYNNGFYPGAPQHCPE
jgi:hypothetical protein